MKPELEEETTQWKEYYGNVCRKSNTPVFLIILIVATLLLISDLIFNENPPYIIAIRTGVTFIGYLSYLLFRLKVISSTVMVFIYIIPTTVTGSLMIHSQTEIGGIILSTSVAMIFGFVMISMFTLSPKSWIVLSGIISLSYLTVILFFGSFPPKVYLANAGALLLICYWGFPYVALIRYRLLKKNFTLQNEIEYYAKNDTLTGCFNRRGGLDLLEQSLHIANRHTIPLSICFIDVNGLKKINDSQGHLAGDKLLKDIKGVISYNIRKSDTLLRYGGDEFIIIFSSCTERQSLQLMKKIEAALIRHQSRNPLSISYGIAEYSPELSLDDFIKIADERMYKDKEKRKSEGEYPLTGRKSP